MFSERTLGTVGLQGSYNSRDFGNGHVTLLRRKPWLPVLRSSLLRRMDQAVEECAAGVLQSLGEGGHASAGFAEDTRGTTAVKPWGSTVARPVSSLLKNVIFLQYVVAI